VSARGEAAIRIAQDGTDQTTTLSAGGAHNRNDLLFGHRSSFSQPSMKTQFFRRRFPHAGSAEALL
jgi:hypothetical protein